VSEPTPTAADLPPDDPGAATDMREWAAALKHDLGKYVAWRSANLSDAAWSGALDDLAAASLRADILATREVGGTQESAWALFDRLTQPWPRPWPRELEAVAAAVDLLRGYGAVLVADDRAAIAAARGDIRSAQQTIRAELASLHRRLMREA
jgi:hypothetical protein